MLAAFYQCYKQLRAFEHTLSAFRKAYPDAELWIVNDGGDPQLAEKANQFAPTHYEYAENIGGGGKGLSWHSSDATIHRVLAWLRRLKQFVDQTSASHFMILEDDVWVKKPTNITALQYDINGCNKSETLHIANYHYIRKFAPGNLTGYYGACGGSILRTDTVRRALADPNMETHVREYCKHKHAIASDSILSFLVLLNGGTIGTWEGYAEAWYRDIQKRLASDTVEVLHQYKDLYSQ